MFSFCKRYLLKNIRYPAKWCSCYLFTAVKTNLWYWSKCYIDCWISMGFCMYWCLLCCTFTLTVRFFFVSYHRNTSVENLTPTFVRARVTNFNKRYMDTKYYVSATTASSNLFSPFFCSILAFSGHTVFLIYVVSYVWELWS